MDTRPIKRRARDAAHLALFSLRIVGAAGAKARALTAAIAASVVEAIGDEASRLAARRLYISAIEDHGAHAIAHFEDQKLDALGALLDFPRPVYRTKWLGGVPAIATNEQYRRAIAMAVTAGRI